MNKHAANRRSRRASGRRRALIPYRLLGWLMLVSAGAVFLFVVLVLISPTIVVRGPGGRGQLLQKLFQALSFGFLLFAFARYGLALARRLRTAPVVIPSSKESVLYLRAFGDELRPFAVGPRSKLKHYTDRLDAHMPSTFPIPCGDSTIGLTLEDFLEDAITARMGPFVALGNPADSLPADGAVREYAPDAEWKQRFLDLAQSAKCIVTALGESDNLQWELNQLKEQGMCQKACMFTPPRRDFGDISERLSNESAWRAELASMWAASSNALGRAGYDCGPDCPGSGAAIAFDENGKSILLTTEASTPDEFIAPVADWFDSHTKTGKCVPNSCSSCHATIYSAATASTPGDLCYSCQVQAKLNDMPPLRRALKRHPVMIPVIMMIWAYISLAIAVELSTSLGWWESMGVGGSCLAGTLGRRCWIESGKKSPEASNLGLPIILNNRSGV
jgi:hypothetical protein